MSFSIFVSDLFVPPTEIGLFDVEGTVGSSRFRKQVLMCYVKFMYVREALELRLTSKTCSHIP